MAFTWSASVIGLSTLTVSGTALPFSDRGGNSSLTLPVLTRAEPTTLRMASCIATGVARAGSTAMIAARPRPAAAASGGPKKFSAGSVSLHSVPQSLNVIRNATTSSICSALRTGLPRQAGATRTSPSVR